MINKVGIIGEAFSGSTVLALMLGAHPDVFNAGELREVLHGAGIYGDRPLCSLCRGMNRDCPFWTHEYHDELRTAPKNDIHDRVLKKSGARVLVDSSKLAPWFQDTALGAQSRQWLFVYLFKDPEEQIASFIMRRNRAHMEFKGALDNWIYTQMYLYNWVEESREVGASVLLMRYRDMAQKPEEALGKILSHADLEFQPRQITYWEYEQHFIGGNTYPLSNYRGLENTASYIEGEEYNRRRYWARQRQIFYDDKWKEVLTPEQKAIIGESKEVARVKKALGID